MDIKRVFEDDLVLLDCISGSTAYGLSTQGSDVDKRGIFVMPFEDLLLSKAMPQVSDERGDQTYFELGRALELLSKANPTIIELFHTPDKSIIKKSGLLNIIQPEMYLSKLCKDTFGGYAFNQIKKARGLKKKIVNPVEKERKIVLDFCFVFEAGATRPLPKYLEQNGLDQSQCGLTKMTNAQGVFACYLGGNYSGIFNGIDSNELRVSSIPKGQKPAFYMSFNQASYSTYCKTYKEYWDWVGNRNEARYLDNVDHGKDYDSKNMMHTFRLLTMAEEILSLGEVRVERVEDREFLLSIKKGEYAYDELLDLAEKKMSLLNELALDSNLPSRPDDRAIKEALLEIRKRLYS